MKSPFLESNDPRLTQAAQAIPVDQITSPETKKNLEYMYSIAYPEQGDHAKPILVGVSASQLGIAKRIVLVDVAADGRGATGDLRAYINPVITHRSAEETEWYEGCYSTAPICGVLSRPSSITVEAYSPEGQPVKEQFEGYIARIFQHELDHLDGRVFITRITDPSKLHLVESADYPAYRDAEGWRNWPKVCPPGRWDEMRQAS